MFNPVLHDYVTEEAATVSSSKSIKEVSPIGYPDIGGWSLPIEHLKPKWVILIKQPIAVNQEGRETSINDWIEYVDPFTQENLLDNEEKRVQHLIFRIRTSLSITHRENLANRLYTLNIDAKEEDSAGIGIALNSLLNFYNFLQLFPDLKYPSVSLTPEYNIYISWRSERHQVFSIHFLSGRDARFIVLKPNEKHPEKQIQVSGTITTDILMEKVEPYSVWEWIRNEKG